MIHPTAVVDKRAEIDEDVDIGPYTVIKKNVKISKGSRIASHVVIDPFVEIGPGCDIFQFAAIGAVPQSVKFENVETHVKIGANTVIREFVTIHRGTVFGGGVTKIGDNNFLMAYSHIAHDCKIGNNVVMANNASLAGHIEVDDNATIGGLVGVHQFVRIGKFAFVGGKSAVGKDIPPFVIAAGDRAKLQGLNKVGLKRNGFTPEAISALKKTYRLIFRIGITLNEALVRVKAEVEQLPEVIEFVEFIEKSNRGITR